MKQSRAIEVSRSRKGCLYLLLTLIIILIPSSPSKFSAGKAGGGCSGGGGTITLANASYLEDVGRFTEVMNQFVDVLLEKVSFLAEIIIQSSMEEQCSIGEHLECKSEGKEKEFISSSYLPYGSNMALDSIVEDGEKFDKLEYTNLTSFVKSIKVTNVEPSSLLDDDNMKQSSSSCKLFNFAVEKQDLPVNNMELCCSNFQNCYMKCGKKKLDCDLEFQQCLKSMCKQNFDYTNKTLLKEMHHVLRRDALMNEPLATDDDSEELDNLEDADDDDDDDDARDKGDDGDEEEEEEDDDDEDEFNRKKAKKSGGCNRSRVSSKTNNKSAVNEEKLAVGNGKERGEREGKPGRGGGGGDGRGERGKRGASIEVNSRQVKRLKDKYKACKLAIKVLIIGNLAFGCQTYKQSQWSACCLVKEGKKPSKEDGEGEEEGEIGIVLDEKGNRKGEGEREGNMNLGEAGGKVDTAFTALQGLPGEQQTFSATITTSATTTTIDRNIAAS